MNYTSFELCIIYMCLAFLIPSYIYLKITDPCFGIFNWGYIFRTLRKYIRRLWHSHK